MKDANVIAERLRALFVESFHIEVPSSDADLIDTGVLDSFQFVELLLQLELKFNFRMAIEDINLDDLRTLNRIARLVAANAGAIDASAARSSSRASEQGSAGAE